MITRIETEGYRLLDGFAADFKQLTVVIGANAVGKSTLLDCLQLINQCAEFPVNTAIGWHWGPTLRAVLFDLKSLDVVRVIEDVDTGTAKSPAGGEV